MENKIEIRLEKEEERQDTENLVRESFWNVYRPGCLEHYVLHVMRKDENFVKELNYVMLSDGKLIGQTVFYKTHITGKNGTQYPVLTLGPICIAPDCQKKGYGKILLDYALEKASSLGYGAVFFEGNIAFYGKCGCMFAREYGIRYFGLPEGIDDSFFLGKELQFGYLKGKEGEYKTPDVYLVDEKEAEQFDRLFPEKKKEKLPSQLFS